MKKIIMFGGIGAVLLIVAVVVFFFVLPKDDEGEKKEKPAEELFFQFEELYTNIPLDDESGEYKILKLQMTLVYTNPDTEDALIVRQAEVVDYLNGYFRDITVETVNRRNGKERVKEEILERLIEIFETDSDDFTKVLLTQFIIQ